MENTEFENQKKAYSNYLKLFYPNLQWTNTIYRDLYHILDRDLNTTIFSLGDYFFEKLLINIDNNLIKIQDDVDKYTRKNDFDDIQKDHIFYYKSFLENRIVELLKENKLKKKSSIKEEKRITHYDKISKELKIINTIFNSQMNPELHLGSGIGQARFCNEIYIMSDNKLLQIGNYKKEYTSRLEKSKNTSLVINELKNIYNTCVGLYNYYLNNLYNHPDKKDFFVGPNAQQQIINSTGHYNFINYEIRFHFFEVEHNSEAMNTINSNLFKNCFRYKCKNETLVNFCVQLIEFIKLSEILNEEKKIPISNKTQSETDNKNPFPQIFTGENDKTFTLFQEFTKNHIINKYIDFSFIFQQMKYQEYVLDIKHLNFMEWLHQNKHINEKEYNNFKIEKSFRSLKKCASGSRLNLYLKLKEEIMG